MTNGVWRDLAHAARSLAKARAFSLVCVVSLGIGMAPVMAVPYAARIFDVPAPGVNTDGFVEILTTRQGPRAATSEWSYPDYLDLRDAVSGMSIAGWATGVSRTTLQTPAGRETVSIQSLFVSANYFDTVGVTLFRGAGFSAAAAEPAVVLTHNFWKNRQASDPNSVGQTITLDGVPHVIAGIAPEHFEGHLGLQAIALFLPLERHARFRDNDQVRFDRAQEWVHMHGRLAPGVGVARADASVAAVTAQLAKQYPATNDLKAGTVQAYHPLGNLSRSTAAILQTVALTLTGVVLVVVCLNIAGMMQVRGAIRERDLSIRQAIGASRGQLIQFLLAEAILLALLGGTLATIVIFNTPPALAWLAGQPLPLPIQQGLKVDLSVILTCFAICLATSLVFGLLPAVRFSRAVVLSSLKDDAGSGGIRVGRVHRATAALQVAIGVPLMVMGGISLDRVRSTATSPLGFESDLLYAAPLNLDPDSDVGFHIQTAREQLATASGVAAVTVADGLPLEFRGRSGRVSVKTAADVAPQFVPVHVTRVGDGYLDTMGIPLLRGRPFTAEDGVGAAPVTIISNVLAEQLFPDADAAEALGKPLTYGTDEKTTTTLTIVGVMADFPTSQMSTEREQLLLPLAQHPNIRRDSAPIASDTDQTPRVMLIARSAPGEPPAKIIAALDTVARELDPEFRSTRIVTGVWLRENSMNDFLTQSFVAGTVGGVILTLSALGIYGVVGLMVATRTREIAVRMALGAARRRVIGMILFDVVKLVAPGVLVGLVLTAVLLRINAENMGISLSRVENAAYVAGAVVAIAVAVAASIPPARRAASVHPMAALRSQ